MLKPSHQLQIDFTVHVLENNVESRMKLEEIWERLSDQCKKMFDLLKDGKHISTRDFYIIHNIGDPRARWRDLRNNEQLKQLYKFESDFIKSGYKEYWITKK